MRATSILLAGVWVMACGAPASERVPISTSPTAPAFNAGGVSTKNSESRPAIRVGTCWSHVAATERARRGPGFRLLDQASVRGIAGSWHLMARPVFGRGGFGGSTRKSRTRVPRLRIGPPHMTGTLQRSAVRAVLRGAETRALRCYTRALGAKPTVRGTVYVSMVIDQSGSATSAVASGVTPRLARCVRRTLAKLRFPPHAGPASVRVSVPLYFSLGYRSTSKPSPRALPTLPAQACVSAVDSGPLRAREPQLESCYLAALERDSSLAWRRQITFDKLGNVSVAAADGTKGNSRLDVCVARLAKRVRLAMPPTASHVTCTLVLDNPAARDAEAIGTRVEITPASITVGGRHVIDTADLTAVSPTPGQLLVAGAVFGREWRGETKQLTLRAHPGIDSRDLHTVLYALRARTSVHYARAIGMTDAWQIVNRGGTADFRACRRARHGVWIEVGLESLRVGYAGKTHSIPRRASGHDFSALVAYLGALRRQTLRGRSDAEVGGRPGVPYRAVLRALEVVHDAGFFEAQIRRVGQRVASRRQPTK